MTMHGFDFSTIHPSWHECIQRALASMDNQYLDDLTRSSEWLPGPHKVFNAFSIPVEHVQYVLIGESPYPRRESANGYAFWDAAVENLWSATGLDKKVNRATSLRNIIKMLLIAEGKLDPANSSQENIAGIDKSNYVTTNQAFFNNFLHEGFLLLNATPVLQDHQPPQKDAKAWLPFVAEVLNFLLSRRPSVHFILFGKIANAINPLIIDTSVHKLYAEHPYNLSFITNPDVLSFFGQLRLLNKRCTTSMADARPPTGG